MSEQGKLFLIPIPIAEGALHTLSPEIAIHVKEIGHYFVENIRTARRFLKSIQPSIVIDNLHFIEIDKHKSPDIKTLKQWLYNGNNVGIMSESGCPGIADPGAELIAAAQIWNIDIIPLTGPNSLILALMASGLNGQSFCFNGYLPVKEPARSQKIKQLEAHSKKENQTQLFIETPYRNNQILQDILKNCSDHTRLCIAQDITGNNQYIKTKKVLDWKKQLPKMGKIPAVFLLLA